MRENQVKATGWCQRRSGWLKKRASTLKEKDLVGGLVKLRGTDLEEKENKVGRGDRGRGVQGASETSRRAGLPLFQGGKNLEEKKKLYDPKLKD